MVTTLVLCLAGPLQSWGTRSHFHRRDTEREPTLSGVVGMITNGLGFSRQDKLDDFIGLSMTSRADRPGTLVDDFFSAGVGDWHGGTTDEERLYWAAYATPEGESGKVKDKDKRGIIGTKHYLADAIFLVLLTSDDPQLINTCAGALRHPRRAYYLGRRGCTPEQPLVLDISTDDPATLVRRWPWLDHPHEHDHERDRTDGVPRQLAILEPAAPGDPLAEPRPDIPVAFDPLRREYLTRLVRRDFTPLTPAMLNPTTLAAAEHAGAPR